MLRMTEIISCENLDTSITEYQGYGFQLDMIFPADAPRTARLSRGSETLTLQSNEQSTTNNEQWVTGRAGMEYSDLIPGRLEGKVIASHIRIPNGGEIADYVHYHKVSFQMIYCVAGAIRVVYEDQGPPFWLKPGDCVLQPPEIRHRVLEAEANSEVVEVSAPAVHETWADHDMDLPNGRIMPGREFSGQQFVRHLAAESTAVHGEFGNFAAVDTGIWAASAGAAGVVELRSQSDHSTFQSEGLKELHAFYFVIRGSLSAKPAGRDQQEFSPGASILVPPQTPYRVDAPANSEILCVTI